uniref:Chromosome 2 open reading frame 76 n=1 Tax=Cyprinus carpio TaxID=7962 RepID=A0A8C1T306_CYPCA
MMNMYLFAVLAVRLVRSFEHRNFKPVFYKDVSLDQTVEEFITFVKQEVSTRAGLPLPFKKFDYGKSTLTFSTMNSLTNELVMSLEDDEKLILRDGCRLQACGVANDTEVAFFRMADYEKFKANPKTEW